MKHFSRTDERFCGSRTPGREFTLDPNRVTCKACKDQDRFTLSPEANEYVKSLTR